MAAMLIFVENHKTKQMRRLEPRLVAVESLVRIFERYDQLTFEAGQLQIALCVAKREVIFEQGRVAKYVYALTALCNIESPDFSEVMRENGFTVSP